MVILATTSLLALVFGAQEPGSEAEILDVLGGQICRCTGYQSILRAVQSAAAKLGASKSSTAQQSA